MSNRSAAIHGGLLHGFGKQDTSQIQAFPSKGSSPLAWVIPNPIDNMTSTTERDAPCTVLEPEAPATLSGLNRHFNSSKWYELARTKSAVVFRAPEKILEKPCQTTSFTDNFVLALRAARCLLRAQSLHGQTPANPAILS